MTVVFLLFLLNTNVQPVFVFIQQPCYRCVFYFCRVGPTMTCCTVCWVLMSVTVLTWDMSKACPSLLLFSSLTWKQQMHLFALPICSTGLVTWRSSVWTKLSLVFVSYWFVIIHRCTIVHRYSGFMERHGERVLDFDYLSGSWQVAYILWKLKAQWKLWLDPLLDHMNPIYTFTSYSLAVLIIFSSHLHLGLAGESFPIRSSDKCVCAFASSPCSPILLYFSWVQIFSSAQCSEALSLSRTPTTR